jgi:hypothetical protein
VIVRRLKSLGKANPHAGTVLAEFQLSRRLEDSDADKPRIPCVDQPAKRQREPNMSSGELAAVVAKMPEG